MTFNYDNLRIQLMEDRDLAGEQMRNRNTSKKNDKTLRTQTLELF